MNISFIAVSTTGTWKFDLQFFATQVTVAGVTTGSTSNFTLGDAQAVAIDF